MSRDPKYDLLFEPVQVEAMYGGPWVPATVAPLPIVDRDKRCPRV